MSPPSRPALKPWLPKVWRDPDTVQIGVGSGAGVLISGLDAATAGWLVGLDGSRTEAEVLADAAAGGLDISTAVRILAGLERSGVLLAGPIGGAPDTGFGALLPELVDRTALRSSPEQGRLLLSARARRHVLIDGANRIGVPLGALLAASGVGRLSFLDLEPVRRCDAAVGGLDPDDEGAPRSSAAGRAVRRISPITDPPVHETAPDADLVIRCRPWAAHDPVQDPTATRPSAQLTVTVREGAVVVGPLVLPGRTSCLRCAELHRTDRDPRWPAVAAQLVAGRTPALREPTTVLACLAAALAAAQILDHFDGVRIPDVIEATLELHPPEWRLRRRSWPPHPECGCLGTTADEVPAAG